MPNRAVPPLEDDSLGMCGRVAISRRGGETFFRRGDLLLRSGELLRKSVGSLALGLALATERACVAAAGNALT